MIITKIPTEKSTAIFLLFSVFLFVCLFVAKMNRSGTKVNRIIITVNLKVRGFWYTVFVFKILILKRFCVRRRVYFVIPNLFSSSAKEIVENFYNFRLKNEGGI